MTSATKTRATVHTSCIVVSSYHYKTNNSLPSSALSTPWKTESPPKSPTNIQIYANPFLREDPLWSRQQPRKRSGRRSLNRRRVPRATARILHADRSWAFSSIRLPLVPSFISILELLFHQAQHHPLQSIFLPGHTTPPPHSWNLYVFQNATETNEPIFNCHYNYYPCCSREERYASQVINIKAKSARPILLHHA